MSMTINLYGNLDPLAGAAGVTETQTTAKAAAADTLPPVKTASATGSSLPTLSDPTGLAGLASMQGVPSLGASVLELIGNVSDEQRRANNEQRFQESLKVVNELHDQADTMRSQAAVNLALGLVSAGIQIGASTFQTVQSVRAFSGYNSSMNAANALANAGAKSEAVNRANNMLQTMNIQIQGVTGIISGSAKIFDSAKEMASTMLDAEMKDREADIELKRSLIAQLDSLNNALKEVIQKAMQTQETIQANTNQTRTKIFS